MLAGKIEVDPDAEAEAVATICMISTPPEIRVAESKYIFSLSVPQEMQTKQYGDCRY